MFREIARSRQALERKECLAVLRESKRGVLSVLGDDGYPYGMPLNHFYSDEDGLLWFHTGKTGHRTDAILRSDKVSYCVTDGGIRNEGEWWLTFRSVIIFGRAKILEDHEKALALCRLLSRKFTSDESYIDEEILRSGSGVLVFSLTPEHITGKRVREK